MTAPSTLDRTDEKLDTGNGRHAHIVPPKDGVNGPSRVMEARVMGTPVQALCGHTWVPSRDPQKFPPCPECVRLFEAEAGDDGTVS